MGDKSCGIKLVMGNKRCGLQLVMGIKRCGLQLVMGNKRCGIKLWATKDADYSCTVSFGRQSIAAVYS